MSLGQKVKIQSNILGVEKDLCKVMRWTASEANCVEQIFIAIVKTSYSAPCTFIAGWDNVVKK